MSEKGNKILYIILSLLLAIVFWLYVDDAQGNTMTQDFTNVPVDFIGAEDALPSRGLMLSEGGDATLDLRLSGPRSVISNLRPGDVRVQVSLTSINAVGTYPMSYTPVYPDNVNASDITIERRSRSAITVQVTRLYTQEVPVSISVVGEVPEGYLFMKDRLYSEPSVITLSGLQDKVDPVASARVVVDISDATASIQQRYSYELLDEQGNVIEDDEIRVSDQQVEVTAPVYMMKEVPLTVKYKEAAGSWKKNTRRRLEPDAITIAGEAVNLETITEISLGEVDLSAYFEFDDDVDIKLPAGCVNISGYTAAHLSVKYIGLDTKNITVTNIQAIGLSERQYFDRITTAVDVVLRGPAEDLELVTEDDIRIVVDLTEYSSDATVRVAATVLVDGYSEVGAVGSYIVTGKVSSR